MKKLAELLVCFLHPVAVVLVWLALIPVIRLRIYVGRIFLAAAVTTVVAAVLLWVARRTGWRIANGGMSAWRPPVGERVL